jgi:CRISPR-associated protein Cmr1
MQTLTVTLKTVTPMFLGGAEPNERAELRPSSIKGALRFWYRAIDPDYRQWEDKIFGSTNAGQGSFALKLIKNNTNGTNGFRKGDHESGINYFGYPLETGKIDKGNYQQRKFIDTENQFSFELIFKEEPEAKIQKAVIASLWLLGNIGGLGFRSRRGFGTVTIKTSNIDNIKMLKHDCKISSIEDWIALFKKDLQTITGWFKSYIGSPDHTVLTKDSNFFVLKPEDNSDTVSWQKALNKAGLLMQEFRNRRSPDYMNVKNHLAKKEKIFLSNQNPPQSLPPSPTVMPAFLKNAPERILFGLPLTFQYRSLDNAKYRNKSITFVGTEHERSASPVFVRIIKINGQYYPFYAILSSPLFSFSEKIKDLNDKSNRPIDLPSSIGIIDDFVKFLQSKGAISCSLFTSP